jgi:hypothetical protein
MGTLLLIVLLIASIVKYKKTIYYFKRDFGLNPKVSFFLLIISWIFIFFVIIL